MSASQAQITAAAARLAFATRFPTFLGGTYAFSCPALGAGDWLPAGHPLASLGCLAVEVPAGLKAQPYVVAEARCRILLEDALAVAAGA